MTAVAVASGFVKDAMSKMVSSVIGAAGAGDPSSPGSPASVREPYASWKTVVPPCPITTTPPGSFWAAIASFISVEIGANSVVAACIPLRVTAYLAEAAATRISTAIPTAMAVRADALLATCASVVGQRLQTAELGAGGTGIGASELPSLIDEQFCGAGRPAKRCLIQAIELCNQIGTAQMWLSAAYSS